MAAKGNRSSRRTQRFIRQAFLELASKRPLQSITVAEVAELADVSRATFYLYYHDLLELRDIIADDFADGFDREVGSRVVEGNPPDNSFALLEAGLEYLKENQDVLNVLLGPNGDVAFVRRLEFITRRYCLAGFESNFSGLGERELALYSDYVISGCVGSMRQWLARGCTETPEQMSRFLGAVILGGAEKLGS